MIDIDKMVFIDHLQVFDGPLVSLYRNEEGVYFIFVKLYEENDNDTYILSDVKLSGVIDYMDKKIRLSDLIGMGKEHYYFGEPGSREFKEIDSDEAARLLKEYGSAEGYFEDDMAYRSVGLRNYIKGLEKGECTISETE